MADLPEHLQEEARSLGRTLTGPGGVESFAQVQRKAASLLKGGEIGIDFTKGDRFETLGAAALFNKRVTEANDVAALARDAATEVERAGFETRRAALLDEATRLYTSISKSGTEAGRNLSARKAIANLSNVPAHWEYEALKVAQRPLADTETATIRQLLDENKRAEMLSYIGTLRPTTATQKAISAWKAFLLTNPVTHIANVSSNTLFAMTEEVASNPAAFADWLATKLIGGERTVTMTSRAILKASAEGAVKGLKDVPDALRGLPTGRALELGEIPRETQYGHPLLTTLFNSPFRALSVADHPFVESAVRGSLARQATILAKAEGAGKARIAELIAHPTDDMVGRALQDAAVRTFRDETPIGNLLHKAQEQFPIAGNIVMPFTRTPGAVATRFAEYTPYGFAKSARLYRQAVKESIDNLPSPLLKQRAAETFGRAATGLAPVALGALLYRTGRASGQTDKGDQSARATGYLLGVPDNAIQIGGNWVEFNRLGPLGMLVSLGAVMAQQAERAGGDPLGATSGAVFGAARVVTDQPFLTGVESLLQAREGEDAAGRYLANLSGSLVPSIVGATQRAGDPVLREAHTAGEKMQSRIPGQAGKLPVRSDQLGRPAQRFGPGAQNLFSPVRVTPDRVSGDPILEEIRATGAVIPALKPHDAEPPADFAVRSRTTGQAVADAVGRLVQDPRYRGLAPVERKDLLENTVTRVRQRETQRLRGRPERPVRPSLGQTLGRPTRP